MNRLEDGVLVKPLDELRESRKANIDRVRALVKEQNRIQRQIRQGLVNGPKTVPEISQATGLPSQTVFWHLMAMKKYGTVEEAGESNSYYRYVSKET
ncbi:MAG: winged helix-turn-helix domain-containing protein [Thermodesulfobacteriota bacterium]